MTHTGVESGVSDCGYEGGDPCKRGTGENSTRFVYLGYRVKQGGGPRPTEEVLRE